MEEGMDIGYKRDKDPAKRYYLLASLYLPLFRGREACSLFFLSPETPFD